MLNFDALNLKEELLKAIQDMGFTEATPIQEPGHYPSNKRIEGPSADYRGHARAIDGPYESENHSSGASENGGAGRSRRNAEHGLFGGY